MEVLNFLSQYNVFNKPEESFTSISRKNPMDRAPPPPHKSYRPLDFCNLNIFNASPVTTFITLFVTNFVTIFNDVVKF